MLADVVEALSDPDARRRIYMRAYRKEWARNNRDKVNAAGRKKSADRSKQRLLQRTGLSEIPGEMKECSRCHEVKSLDEFYLRKRMSARTGSLCYRSHCTKCEAKQYRDVHAGTTRHKEYHRRWKLKSKFDITPQQYQEIFNSQDGACGICGKTSDDDPRKEALVVDHDHKTGSIRGLLCRHCNIGIGKLGDTLSAAEKAVEYLRKPPAIDRT